MGKKIIKVEARTMDVRVLDLPEQFTAKWIAEQIGAEWIEIVRPVRANDFVMIVDEEGRLRDNMYVNTVASWLYGSDKHGEVILGDCVLMMEEMGPEGPDLAGIDEFQAKKIQLQLDSEKSGMTMVLLTALHGAGAAKKIMRGNEW